MHACLYTHSPYNISKLLPDRSLNLWVGWLDLMTRALKYHSIDHHCEGLIALIHSIMLCICPHNTFFAGQLYQQSSRPST